MRCRVGAAVCVAVTISASDQKPVAPAGTLDAAVVIAGVVRCDGILLPLGTYGGQAWTTKWPEANRRQPSIPGELSKVPVTWLGGREVPPGWTLWTRDGRSREIRVVIPESFRAHCSAMVGLRTDVPKGACKAYFKEEPAADWLLGTALVGRASVVTPTDVPVGSPAFDAVDRFLQSVIGEVEDRPSGVELRTTTGARPGVPVPRPQREQARFVLSSVLSDGPVGGEASLCYHGVKDYGRWPDACPPEPGPGGVVLFPPLLLVSNGWLHRRAAGDFIIQHEEHQTCGGEAEDLGPPFDPLAVLRISGRSFWIGNVRGYEDESFQIIETSTAGFRQVLYVSGGGC